MALKENYKDDILDVSVNTKRKYRMTDNGDGTVSLDDETVYTQEGDSFGASDMNATNGKVNALETDIGEINDNLTTINNNLTEFVYLNPNVTTLEGMIDAFIASNQNNLKLGQECAVRMSNSPTSPGVYYAIKITRTSYDGERYYGYAFNYTDVNKKYNFLKIGGASTVISPFRYGYDFCGFAKNRGYNATIFSCVDGVIRSSTSSLTTNLFTLSASGYTVNITLRKKVDAVWMNSNGRTSTAVGTYNNGQSFSLCNYDGDGQGGVFIITKVY